METINSFASVFSAIGSAAALTVSYAAFRNSVKVRKNAENIERIQYAPRLAASVYLDDQPQGHLLSGLLDLSNASEKQLSVSNVSISGDTQADTGDPYRVLSSELTPTGTTTIKSGEGLELPFKLVVGVGSLKILRLEVFLEGIDSKGERFRCVIPLGNCV